MSKIFEDAINAVPAHVQERTAMSLDVADRIHAILEMKGMTHKDLALALGKSESEISKWMRGTHNFTFETIAKINLALGAKIIDIPKQRQRKQVDGRLHHLYATVVPLSEVGAAGAKSDLAQYPAAYKGVSERKITFPFILRKS